MAAPCGDRKQFGNRWGLTIRRSKNQFLVWDSELRLAIMCFICFLVMSFAQFLLWLFSLEGILAYELMAGHPPFEFFGCNMFLQNLQSPSISPHPFTRGPRTRCKFTRRCVFLDATKKRHFCRDVKRLEEVTPGEQRHQQGELPEKV